MAGAEDGHSRERGGGRTDPKQEPLGEEDALEGQERAVERRHGHGQEDRLAQENAFLQGEIFFSWAWRSRLCTNCYLTMTYGVQRAIMNDWKCLNFDIHVCTNYPQFQDGQEESNSNDDREAAEQVIVSYELVQQLEIDYTRPVIVLGPLKDRINDELISG